MSERVAFVTGGTGGIGTAICQQLFKDGYHVVAGYCNGGESAKAQQWQTEQREQGYDIHIQYVDVASEDSCISSINEIVSSAGPIDVLVNNAGITRDTTFKKMASKQWQDVISVNLDGAFNVTRQVVPNMIAQGYGRIVNISSVNALKGQFGQVNYSAAKAGLLGFTKSLAQEVAKSGITVNAVSPGYTETEMVRAIPAPVRDQILSGIPVGRFAQPSEIARIVGFLAAKESGFITGTNIDANGGQHMH